MGRLLSRLAVLAFGALLSATAGAVGHVYPALDGGSRSLDEFLGGGRWAVVAIWASDCTTCNLSIREMVDFQSSHGGDKADVVSISIDGQSGREQAAAFRDRHQVNFPVLLADTASVRSLMSSLGAGEFHGTPTYLIFNPQGQLAGQGSGYTSQGQLEYFILKQTQAARQIDRTAAP
ncbi:MAG: TlpA family protein disulfide reductase [Gammaproteobacteria bacterium]|jgi:peroxiredoxin|nr:TlpA family protein disulfide reductase [Gammaproteobacteria bacterium]